MLCTQCSNKTLFVVSYHAYVTFQGTLNKSNGCLRYKCRSDCFSMLLMQCLLVMFMSDRLNVVVKLTIDMLLNSLRWNILDITLYI